MSDHYAIIVAGGKGVRMGHDVPKQFIEIAGVPIVIRTVRLFSQLIPPKNIVLVLPGSWISDSEALLKSYNLHAVQTVAGGATRFDSVNNGLTFLAEDVNQEGSIVAIHDAVRPFAPSECIQNSYSIASLKGSAVVSVKLKDSIRLLENEKSKVVNREDYRVVQTPQTFRFRSIFEAYQQASHNQFTDDAAVLENLGYNVELIEGDYRNIKVTTPEDLIIAESFVRKNPD